MCGSLFSHYVMNSLSCLLPINQNKYNFCWEIFLYSLSRISSIIQYVFSAKAWRSELSAQQLHKQGMAALAFNPSFEEEEKILQGLMLSNLVNLCAPSSVRNIVSKFKMRKDWGWQYWHSGLHIHVYMHAHTHKYTFAYTWNIYTCKEEKLIVLYNTCLGFI